MQRSQLSLSLAAFSSLAALPAAAGTVWTVDDDGPADFADLPAAVSAAADSDTLIVADGSYSPFTLDAKGLLIFADTGAEPLVDGRVTIQQIGADQTVVIRGLSTGDSETEGLVLSQNAGAVFIEDGSWIGANGFDPYDAPGSGHADGYDAVQIAGSNQVSLTRVTLVAGTGNPLYDWESYQGAGGRGLFIANSDVAVYDSIVRGGRGGSAHYPTTAGGYTGGPGLRLFSGNVTASGTTFIGGQGGSGGDNWMWYGCGNGADGGVGALLETGELVRLETEFEGGAPGYGTQYYGCQNGQTGPGMLVNSGQDTALIGSSNGFVAPAPLREGETRDVTFSGTAGNLAVLLFSTEPGHTLFTEFGSVLVLGGSLNLVSAGTILGDGTLTLPLTGAALPPSVAQLFVLGQGAQVSPGGDAILGSPSMVLMLPN